MVFMSYACGICGFAMHEVDECLHCKLTLEATAQAWRREGQVLSVGTHHRRRRHLSPPVFRAHLRPGAVGFV